MKYLHNKEVIKKMVESSTNKKSVGALGELLIQKLGIVETTNEQKQNTK